MSSPPAKGKSYSHWNISKPITFGRAVWFLGILRGLKPLAKNPSITETVFQA
jgi:hypothetical protein